MRNGTIHTEFHDDIPRDKAGEPGLSSQPLDIDKIIDSNRIGGLQMRVVVLCFFLAMIDGFDVVSLAFVAPAVSQQFALGPEVMGQLISAALVGLMIGAFVGSPIADRLGRKPVIIASVVTMGGFSLLTAFASGAAELFACRLLTGLGLGALMPNINVLTAEFAPARRRAFLMTLMYVGLPIGTIVGGLASAGLIATFGWRSVFVIGGVLPLAMVPLLIHMLPESPSFLALRADRASQLARIINRIAPQTNATPHTHFRTATPEQHSGVRALFAGGRAKITLLIWVLFFTNLLTLNAIVGWLPSVLNAAGFPLERAILTTVLFSVGGVVGGLIIALAIDRFGAVRTMTASLLAATASVAIVGQVSASLPMLLPALFLAGGATMGSQFGLNALASSQYETGSRATGLGWALAVGRLGGIGGPILVGAALATGLPLAALFLFGAAPVLVAAGCVMLLGRFNEPVR